MQNEVAFIVVAMRPWIRTWRNFELKEEMQGWADSKLLTDSVYIIHCPVSYSETFRRRNTQTPLREEWDIKETPVSTPQQF
jgi:hypothetical protein